jgi:hypothetical protein
LSRLGEKSGKTEGQVRESALKLAFDLVERIGKV